MSNKKQTQKGSVVYDGFGGIDHTLAHSGRSLANDIVNFRILKDGSLEKRFGYRLLTDMGAPIRALHSVAENGVYTLYVLAGDSVHTVDTETGETSFFGSIGSSEGKAFIFNYGGYLFIADSVSLYRYMDEAFNTVTGYVPHFGKDWPNNVPGEIHEPRNILNKHARITYIVSEQRTIYLPTKFPVASVEAVYCNNVLVKPEGYYIDDEFTTVNVSGIDTGDELSLYLTFKEGYDSLYDTLVASGSAAIFGGKSKNRLFLCGKKGSSTVFCSRHVSDEALRESRLHYPESDELYFPFSYEFSPGDGVNGVQAVTRHQDKLLIFTEGDVWMAAPDSAGSDEFPATSVNPRIGCSSVANAIPVENYTVSIGDHSVWLWSSDADFPNNCKATKISEAIDDELNQAGLKSCGLFFDSAMNEIWIYHKEAPISWIYNLDSKHWYKFEGIQASMMTDIGGNVAFVRDNSVFIIKKECEYDQDSNGNAMPIRASYTTVLTDLGTEAFKNLKSLTMRCDLKGEPLDVEFESEDTSPITFTVEPKGDETHSIIKKRLRSGRFKNATFKIVSEGLSRQVVHDLSITVR